MNSQCQKEDAQNKIKCKGSILNQEYFQTRITMQDPSGANINSITLDVRSGGERCQRSYDVCNADGTAKIENADNYCFCK